MARVAPTAGTVPLWIGAAIGAASAAPFASLVLVVFLSGFPAFAWGVATASLFSGVVTGGTVGRRVATRPTTARIAGAAAVAVLIGAPVGAAVYSALWPTPSYDFATLAVAGLAIYGLPAYFLIALPGLVLGLAILRRTSVVGR